MKKITPFLWFNNTAEEAARYYTGIFPDSSIRETRYYSAGAPAPEGSVMSVTIEIAGQELVAFNGGPGLKFSPAMSMFVTCESQAEVDDYWEKLSVEGAPQQCGWLTDKYGVSWQIVPLALDRMLKDPDAEKSARVMQALMQMVKLDIATLERAYRGE
ncbi:VOC family protein [Paraburkholderia sp.]|uniref:VOC family protein n=1 Tax=Paraburkholderia sp. TaxID=1926495 RepID=UPI0023959FAE|nr:VOC family protein [Paraburkholderia sp.]MDE1182784.1 VOC family protein [Paraburkholderia sp.]